MSQTNPRPPVPLPVTITPGMSVVSLDGNPIGQILGITQAHCVYQLVNHISVEPWRNLALAGVCPAEPAYPSLDLAVEPQGIDLHIAGTACNTYPDKRLC